MDPSGAVGVLVPVNTEKIEKNSGFKLVASLFLKAAGRPGSVHRLGVRALGAVNFQSSAGKNGSFQQELNHSYFLVLTPASVGKSAFRISHNCSLWCLSNLFMTV